MVRLFVCQPVSQPAGQPASQPATSSSLTHVLAHSLDAEDLVGLQTSEGSGQADGEGERKGWGDGDGHNVEDVKNDLRGAQLRERKERRGGEMGWKQEQSPIPECDT